MAFSTDSNVASRGVYLLSFLPETDVNRIVDYAAAQGKRSYIALVPDNPYGGVVEAERAVVFAIGGGGLAPVAAHHDGSVLTGMVAAEDGSWLELRQGDDPAALAAELATLADK